MQFNGTEWVQVGDAGFTSSGIYEPSLAFTSQGIPYVAYVDESTQYKASVMKFGPSGSN